MKARSWQGLVAGVGGQGVIFVTRLLSGGLSDLLGNVLVSEVHGMAQRGGSVVSHIKAGKFAGPLVRAGQADGLISLEPGEAIRNLSFLAPKAKLVVNAAGPEFLSPTAQRILARQGVELFCADAAGAALQAGAPKGGNVVLLAAAAAAGMLPLDLAEFTRLLGSISPPARRRQNTALLELGRDLAQNQVI
jgi:indolepyruvate ferredoxin oxidoreductase beta subunit